MQVNLYYLNWDKGETQKGLDDKSYKIFMDSMLNKQNTFEKAHYRKYTLEIEMTPDKIEDPESFLELVYLELNKDTRSNSQTERSMCAGDVIAFKDKSESEKQFIVLGLGFTEIES